MSNVDLAVSGGAATPPPSVTYELHRKCGADGFGPWVVRAIKYSEAEISHEIKFREERKLNDVIGNGFFDFFKDYLPVDAEPFILAAKDAEFRRANTIAKNIRVTAMHNSEDTQFCRVKIMEYQGHLIENAQDSPFMMGIFELRDTLISSVVADILLPILNFSSLPADTRIDADSDRKVIEFLEFLRSQNSKIAASIEYLVNCLNDSPNNQLDRSEGNTELH